MRILHTADWHLGRKLDGRSRYDEQQSALDEICAIADDESVDAVLIAGDVFDTFNPPAEAESLFYRTMTRLADGGRRAVVVIAGNHDSPDRLIASDPYARALGITTVGYPKDIPARYDGGSDGVSCIESAPSFVRLRAPGAGEVLTVLALPYPSEARLREVLTEDIADEEAALFDYNRRIRAFMKEAATRFIPGQTNIVASHLFVLGGIESGIERPIQVGGVYAVDPMSFPAEACYVALGHLHRDQEMRGERDVPVRYSGSILQYSFSEAGQEKSVTLIDCEKGCAQHRQIPLGAGRRLERWRADGTDELEQRLAGADPSAWLSITVALDEPLPPDYMARLREMHAGIIDCVPEYRQSADGAEEMVRLSELPIEEQFRRFIENRYGAPPNESVLRLFMELAVNGHDAHGDEPA